MTEYQWDTSCADLELRRLEHGYTEQDHLGFARILVEGFAKAQADVHVQTGRLRSSGRAEIDSSTSEGWSGEIRFGGGTVRWAASEFFGYADKHGGYPSHQYFKKLGWLPNERSVGAEDGVPWAQSPARDVPGSEGIQDDMMGPVTGFFDRGQHTPHPERGGK